MQYFVYIIYSFKKDKYYVGQTENIERRVAEHNIRKNLGADDWVLRYKEVFENRSEAMKRETEIKRKREEAI